MGHSSRGHAEALPEVVVVATSHERETTRTPATVHALDLTRLRLEQQAGTFPEALGGIPGIMLQQTGYGMTSPYLRGQTGQRVVMVADGIRLNTSILREGPNQYWNLLGTYLYDDLDALMGPASVLYGSDAIGGVFLAHTRPLLRGEPGKQWQWQGGAASGRWSSAEHSFSEAIAGNLAWTDAFGLRVALERQDFGELRTGDGTENPATNYEQWGGALRATWWLADSQALHAGYDHHDQDDVDRVHKTIDYVPWHGTTGGDDGRRVFDHERHAAFLRYQASETDDWLHELETGVAWQRISQRYRRYRTNGTIRADQPTQVDTFGAWLTLTSRSAFGTWTYGADAWTDFVDSWDALTPGSPGEFGDDSTYQTLGLFVQNELPLGEQLELISACRYSYIDLESRQMAGYGDMRGNWDALTMSARLAWHIHIDRMLYIGMAQGFRAPNLADCTRLGEYASGSFEAPAGELAEERYLTYELGAKSHGAWGQLRIAAHYTAIEDRIGRLKLNGENTKRNLGDGHIQGIEAQVECPIGTGLAAFGSIAWQEGSEETYVGREITLGETERYLSRVAPIAGQIGLRWRSPTHRFWGETCLRWADHQNKLSDGDKADSQRIPEGGTPGYGVVDLRGGWRFDEHTDVAVAVENITDKDYRIHGSGVNRPGRNLLVTLRRTF